MQRVQDHPHPHDALDAAAPVPPGYLTARTLGPYAAGSAVPRMEISVKARKRAQSWRKPTSGSTQTRLPTLAHLATLSLLVDD